MLVRVALFLLAGVLTAVSGAHAESRFAGRNGSIVFSSDRHGMADLYALSPAGGVTRLTRSIPPARNPTFSPDGRRIAFERGPDGTPVSGLVRSAIWVMDSGGRHAQEFVPASPDNADDSTPEWSPDGHRLAFLRSQSNLSVFDLRTGRTTAIPGAHKAYGELSWSPDGRQIAYGQSCAIFVSSAPGGKTRRLVSMRNACLYSPAWAPAGRSLALVRDRRGFVEIVLVRADGSGARSVLRRRRSWTITSLGWAPGGRRLVFDGGPGEVSQIYVLRPSSGRLTNLTPGRAYGYEPEFAPDGRTILYSRSAELRLVRPDGKDHAVGATRHVVSPTYSSDGQRIAFAAWDARYTRPGSVDVYSMRADGTRRRRLTSHRRGDRDPGWSPDGKRIAFVSGRQGGGLFVMRATGESRAVRIGRLGNQPRWSPGGGEIAYTEPGSPDGDLLERLRILNIRSHRSRPLLRGLDRARIGTARGSWSPDGKSLAFVRLDRARSELHVALRDGTGDRSIAVGADSPVWSPDGRLIAFIRAGVLYEVEVATGRERRIDTGIGRVLSIDWQPLRR